MVKIRILVLISLCLVLSGCATTRARSEYMGEVVTDRHFKGLSDEETLAFFYRIYDEPVDTEMDQTAKDITITAFMMALEARKSQYIADSGVLQKPYRKIYLNGWSDEQLVEFYNSLVEEREKRYAELENDEEMRDASGRVYWGPKKRKSDEEIIAGIKDEDTLEIIQLTALYAVNNERIRKGTFHRAWRAAGSVAITGISTAAQIAAQVLAGFFLMA